MTRIERFTMTRIERFTMTRIKRSNMSTVQAVLTIFWALLFRSYSGAPGLYSEDGPLALCIRLPRFTRVSHLQNALCADEMHKVHRLSVHTLLHTVRGLS